MKFLTQENVDTAQEILQLFQHSDERAFRIKLYTAHAIPLFLAANVFIKVGMVNAAILCLEQFKLLEFFDLTSQDFSDSPEENQQILDYFKNNDFATLLLWKKASLLYPNSSMHQRGFEQTYTAVLASLRKKSAEPESEDEKKVTFKQIATVCYFYSNTSPSSIANNRENDTRRSPVNFGG